jgi:hypothetical protein
MVMKKWPTLFQVVLTMTLLQCSTKITSTCDSEKSVTIPTNPTMPVEAAFAAVQTDILTPNCARAGCHTGSSAAANLNLSNGFTYKNIVNVKSREDPSFMLVLPGNASKSFLYLQISNGIMPPTGKLSQGKIDQVAAWINNGAQNN